MLKFQSNIREIAKSQNILFNYLKDLNNYYSVFRSPKVKNIIIENDSINFQLDNLGIISLKFVSINEFKNIKLANNDTKPFMFYLSFNIEHISENVCTIQTTMDAEINPIMKMMIQKPLIDFLNELNNNI